MLRDFLTGRWLGHPLHPLLVHVPAGAWPAAAVFDALALADLAAPATAWAAWHAMVLGIAVGLLAAPAGLADWWGIKRGNPAWALGLYHLGLNVAALAVWSVNAALRWAGAGPGAAPGAVPVALSVVGTLLVLASAYLGGRLVYHHGISVARLSRGRLREIAQRSGADVAPESD